MNRAHRRRATAIGLFGSIALGLVLALPQTARAQSCGMGNPCALVDSLTTSMNPAAVGAIVDITCNAHDPNGVITRFTFLSSTGQYVASASTTLTHWPASQTQYSSATVQWQAPSSPATATITCRAWDNGGFMGIPTQGPAVSISLPVEQASVPPPIIDAIAPATSSVLPGSAMQLVVTAHSPAGRPLSYAWSVAGVPVGTDSPTLDWIAPGVLGGYRVDVAVSDDAGNSVSASAVVNVVLKISSGPLAARLIAPRRLASRNGADLYAVDARDGRLWLLSARGEVRGRAPLVDRISAVAAGSDRVFVTTDQGRLLTLDPTDGTASGEIALADGPAITPDGLAYVESAGLLLIAEREANRVRAVRLDGSTAFYLTHANGETMLRPIDVAVDSNNQRIWVAVREQAARGQLHAFDFSGNHVRSLLPDTDVTAVARCGGLSVDSAGVIYLADAFQGRVQLVDDQGVSQGQVGEFGKAAGQLAVPTGLAWLGNGDLIVASLDTGRLERFGLGATLPSCVGDRDCDGIVDAVELAHGLDPDLASDALSDLDGDGLSALNEIGRGTDPRSADTDGDGFSDGFELANGFNPLDPLDHRPLLIAGPPQQSDPGLVRFSSTLQGEGTCRVSWVQSNGPAVALRGAETMAPSFIGRAAGTYRFRGVAVCGGMASAPAELRATVRNVAPLIDPGRQLVLQAGQSFVLDGALSSDANGDPLQLGWDQALGYPLLEPGATDQTELVAPFPALLRFELTGRDPMLAAASAAVDVVVVDEDQALPGTAVETPIVGRLQQAVTLHATVAPQVAGMTSYIWEQVAGPAVSFSNSNSAAPSFVPAQTGHYAFTFSVSDDAIETPPLRVDVYVAETDGLLPEAVAGSTIEAIAGEPIVLDGSASRAAHTGAALDYRWRQLAGPAAGLTDAASASATVVPFAAGRHLFELVVSEGGVQSVPAQVVLVATHGACAPLRAQVSNVGTATAPAWIALRGRASGNCGQPARFRWTQKAGPWVALDDAESPTPRFLAKLPGSYRFELEVDDGVARSAPASITVNVQQRGGNP